MQTLNPWNTSERTEQVTVAANVKIGSEPNIMCDVMMMR